MVVVVMEVTEILVMIVLVVNVMVGCVRREGENLVVQEGISRDFDLTQLVWLWWVHCSCY
jgi:hypothetical protein